MFRFTILWMSYEQLRKVKFWSFSYMLGILFTFCFHNHLCGCFRKHFYIILPFCIEIYFFNIKTRTFTKFCESVLWILRKKAYFLESTLLTTSLFIKFGKCAALSGKQYKCCLEDRLHRSCIFFIHDLRILYCFLAINLLLYLLPDFKHSFSNSISPSI